MGRLSNALPTKVREPRRAEDDEILVPGARLLFTSTAKPAAWNDGMTGLESLSLGAEQYGKLLGAVGISVAEEYEDEGENHYFDAFKGKIA
jgi:hypothetical protein